LTSASGPAFSQKDVENLKDSYGTWEHCKKSTNQRRLFLMLRVCLFGDMLMWYIAYFRTAVPPTSLYPISVFDCVIQPQTWADGHRLHTFSQKLSTVFTVVYGRQ
jgi:hypothetical protein